MNNEIISNYHIMYAFITALLFLIITRSSKITIIVKKSNQRTKKENLEVKRGLLRSLLLEGLLFIPSSIVLFRLTVFPLFSSRLVELKPDITLWYAVMGITAYGFPFATISNSLKL